MDHAESKLAANAEVLHRKLVSALSRVLDQEGSEPDENVLKLVSPEEDFQVLQQREILDRHTESRGDFQELACLATSSSIKGRTAVVLSAVRSNDQEEWKVTQLTYSLVDDSMPYRPYVMVGGQRVVIGVITNTPDIAAIRLTISDGTQVLERVANGGALILLPIDPSKQTSVMGALELLDKNGESTGSVAVRVLSHSDKLAS